MNLKWEPYWYELDQTIVVGDIDFFYLSTDKLHFTNGFIENDEYEVKAEILSIHHSELGEIKGIVTYGLDYSIYLSNGDLIIVNAEEDPGSIEESKYSVSEWEFDVQVRIMEWTGVSFEERLSMFKPGEQKIYRNNRLKRYKALLNVDELLWE